MGVENEGEQQVEARMQGAAKFMGPANAVKVMQKKMAVFGTYALIIYLIEFCMVVYSLHSWSSGTCIEESSSSSSGHRLLRMLETTTDDCVDNTEGRFQLCGSATTIDDAEAVYDTAILLFFIYHAIEWVRYTIFLTSILLGVNLVGVFYLLGLNSLFGIVVFIVGILARFGGDGADCASVQETRGTFLLVAIIIFVVKIWFTFCPTMFFKFISIQTMEAALVDEEEEEEGGKD